MVTTFNPVDLDQAGLFCSKCVRNQHLLIKALGSYLPDPDDPAYPAFEREYPKFRRNMEERYPQVCENCESQVNLRIRQTGYEAKADHLRRIMERSKAGRAAKRARNRNWRSLLFYAGAIGSWGSVAGQLSWNVIGALESASFISHEDSGSRFWYGMSYVSDGLRQNGYSSTDLAPNAGVALILALVSFWWFPTLRLKIDGMSGRFVGLIRYYQFQLVVLVTRILMWQLLKDPDTSSMEPSLPPTLHAFMIFFISMVSNDSSHVNGLCLTRCFQSVIISRQIVRYDTRPLVLWSENTPVASPLQKPTSDLSAGGRGHFQGAGSPRTFERFPIDRLGIPRETPNRSAAIPDTPPPEDDSMDWTPSSKQEIRPRYLPPAQESGIILNDKSPFYGSLPEAPRPPSWQLRNPTSRRPPERVIEQNPFHRSLTQLPSTEQNGSALTDVSRGTDAQFAAPRFFPPSDYGATTGLETLFDQTFTIRSPADESDESAGFPSHSIHIHSNQSRPTLTWQCVRAVILLTGLLMWQISQTDLVSVSGNVLEIMSLILSILIAGFALLAALNKPTMDGMEILVSFAELASAFYLALRLGFSGPQAFLDRVYFYWFGMLLLGFMSLQEVTGLCLSCFRARSRSNVGATDSAALVHSPGQNALHSRTNSQGHGSAASSPPSLLFSSSQGGSHFSQPAMLVHAQPPPAPSHEFYRKDLLLDHLRDDDSDGSEASAADSDAETTATSYTNRTIRYMNPFHDSSDTGRKPGLGSGLQGLSLNDSPGRATRSNHAHVVDGDVYRRYPLRRNR